MRIAPPAVNHRRVAASSALPFWLWYSPVLGYWQTLLLRCRNHRLWLHCIFCVWFFCLCLQVRTFVMVDVLSAINKTSYWHYPCRSCPYCLCRKLHSLKRCVTISKTAFHLLWTLVIPVLNLDANLRLNSSKRSAVGLMVHPSRLMVYNFRTFRENQPNSILNPNY